MSTQSHPFQGTVIVDAQQLADIVAVMTAKAVREELDRREAIVATPLDDLPDEVPAKLAAKFLNYATGKSLAQYHGQGLTPLRVNGKRLFYKKAELVKLKKRLMNL